MQVLLKEAMSNHPMTVRYKDDLRSAYIRMRREGYRHMPVINEAGDLVGIISDRDFQRAMWPINSFDAHGLPEEPNFRKDARVSEYMSWPAVALPENTNLEIAIEAMIEKKISAIVVTRNSVMAGIITNEDLLKILVGLFKNPPTLRAKFAGLTYSSPLRKVTEMLSAAGI